MNDVMIREKKSKAEEMQTNGVCCWVSCGKKAEIESTRRGV